jgi:hypothetical protein
MRVSVFVSVSIHVCVRELISDAVHNIMCVVFDTHVSLLCPKGAACRCFDWSSATEGRTNWGGKKNKN